LILCSLCLLSLLVFRAQASSFLIPTGLPSSSFFFERADNQSCLPSTWMPPLFPTDPALGISLFPRCGSLFPISLFAMVRQTGRPAARRRYFDLSFPFPPVGPNHSWRLRQSLYEWFLSSKSCAFVVSFFFLFLIHLDCGRSSLLREIPANMRDHPFQPPLFPFL